MREVDLDRFGESVVDMATDTRVGVGNGTSAPAAAGAGGSGGGGSSMAGMAMMAQMMMGPTRPCGQCGKDIAEEMFQAHVTTWCVKVESTW